MIISIMVSSIFVGSSNNFAFAQIQNTVTPVQTIFITNVSVDSAPLPNKPFKISADILTQNPSDLLTSISAPIGISVTSPIFAKPTTTSGGTMRATWTVVAGQPGTYSITVLAHANFPVQDVTSVININVGTPNSLVITGVNIPGNIFPGDVFEVSLSLKNVGSADDSNVLTTLTVPDGIQLVSNVGENSSSMKVNEEKTFSWTLKSQFTGSYAISFFYSSTNSGSNSIDSTVNVGQQQIPDLTISKVGWGGFNVTSFLVGPGDRFVPITATIDNVGNQGLFNLNVKLLLTPPFASDSGATDNINGTKDYYIGRLNIGGTQDATYYVNIQKNIPTGVYLAHFIVQYTNGKITNSRSFELPVLISDTGFKFTSVITRPSVTYAGDTGDEIIIPIFNSGLAANDVKATLLLPPGLSTAWGNSTTLNIGRIPTFTTVPASFFVNVANNVTAGSLPFSLVLKHDEQITKFDLSFTVAPKANFKLISVDDSQISSSASGVPFKVTLQNVGNAPAETLTTKLLSGNMLAGEKSSTSYSAGNQENLGTILPGQSFTTSFMVDVDPSVVGDQSTSVELDWGQNKTGSFVQTVSVPYHAGGNSYTLTYGGIPWTYIVIGIVVMVSILVFISKRKKRKQFMDFTEIQLRDENSLDRKDT